MKKLAISIGDINGIGLEILARSHEKLSQFALLIILSMKACFKKL